jgi:AcrR family transcriptional regulator
MIKRPLLTPERIAAAALALADEHGLEGFSFRTLAKNLGCQAMSVYHYYPSKAHLLDAMVDSCLGELVFAADTQDWQERLRQAASTYRAMALRHPGFFPFIGVYRMNSRAGLAVLDQILKIFEATGLDVEKRARHFRAFGYYIVGACLDETIGYAKGPSAAEPVPDNIVARDFPSIISVEPFFGADHHTRTFEHGLEAILVHIEKDVSALS